MAHSSNSGDTDSLIFQLGTRIDSLQKIPLSAGVLLAVSVASFFTYYDFSNYAYISPMLKESWNVQDSEIALGASLTVLGYVIGAVLITIYADLYGRKPALIISVLILAAGSILAASAQDMSQMVIFRLITGIGIGSEIAIVTTYIGEMSPRSKRGKYTSLVVFFGWTGIAVSGPISFALFQSEINEVVQIESWRIILAIAVVPALVALILRMGMPESLRWLISKGKTKEANRLLIKLGLDPVTRQQVVNHSKMKDESNKVPDVKEKAGQDDKKELISSSQGVNKNLSLLFKNIVTNRRPIFGRIFILSAIWSLALIPIYASLLLVVEYTNQGYEISESISVNMIASSGFVAGGICSLIVADRLERKYQIAFSCAIIGLAFILRGIFIHDYVGLVISSFIAFAANAWMISNLLTYTSEYFPTEIRSTCSGIVEGIGRLIGTIGPLIFIVLVTFGFLNLMIGLSSFSFVAAIVVLLLGRNTLNQSLEKLNA
ncbi:MAG TPA: MFS transporter [Nitrososphaeraceae archaeon]|nr:MFS transporter [Nitrososphaeraceae archaeon]